LGPFTLDRAALFIEIAALEQDVAHEFSNLSDQLPPDRLA
jgi:hypothetical protein